ncbi:PBP1A family penicillin-binding protein [Flavobacterium salilacus subsp. salilacus]|uniref:penicillin-binding protein 1A n=1 Tax=Flavobacterium TaxID=237 RepID=UPI0010756754|nr:MULTISPECIES: PBP1A family penicillin-binding protein [Flavobacterium]KAF2518933.1 PBP1A family penicillin-binding protein [Flavobacterium salilacus subsp. salilacus]MBE1614905.1 PBP1A family penicillin-binding protein [Flavobacterium sp. SaA2.13]
MATGKNTKSGNSNDGFFRYIKTFWLIFLIGLVSVVLFFLMASWGVFGKMPTFDELENPDSNVATEVISSDGVTIGKFYLENRTPVKYADLPQHLVDALVATEDERFFEHSGIDARGTLRAALTLGGSGGASTISQQLAKNLFHGEGSKNIVERIAQKAKEWVIAIRLERQYTKQEIIAMYLNTVDFVHHAVGIRSAAKTYFGKEPKELTVEEVAVIVGMLKNPSQLNPKSHPESSLARRNVVLGQMVKNGFLKPELKAELEKKEIKLNFNPEDHNEGIATYFREYLRDFMKKWVKEHPKEDGTEYDIYRDGLKIYVTLDSRMQKYAEESVHSHLANLQEEFFIGQKKNENAPFVRISKDETTRILERAMKNSERWRIMSQAGKTEKEIRASFNKKAKMTVFSWKGERDTIMTPMDSIRYYKHFLQAGLMSMDPETGQVKAWVGGIDHKHFKYDHVEQGARQVGSTFKPFVYATAIEQLHYTPCDTIIDSPFSMPKGKYGIDADWHPQNSNGKFEGPVTLKYALAHSINTVSAKLIDQVGPKAVVDLTKKLGITSNIPEQPAIALGAAEITVREMVAAYSAFANKGMYIKPMVITRIEDKNGVELFRNTSVTREVVSKDIAYAVIKLLQGVTETGSGGRLRWGGPGGTAYNRMTGYPYALTNPIAGKTGTTQNQSDGWFMGMVPNLATGVWVGNEDRSAHFRSLTYGQGATMALPIWGMFMKKCYGDKELNVSKKDFERPENLSIKVDCNMVIEKDSTEVDLNLKQFDF